MKLQLNIAARQLIVLTGMFGVAVANAQWTVVNLGPGGGAYSQAYGVGGGQQVGTTYNGANQATLWSGTPGSLVNLHPSHISGANFSTAAGVSGGQQVGVTSVFGVTRACMWSSTALSWVDLHPAGASESRAHAVNGGKQVGYAWFGSLGHASLWSGTSASWVSLNPAGSTNSEAIGIGGGKQVGVSLINSVLRASLWTNTAASFVSLHPTGADWSVARAADVGQQVGNAQIANASRASLWTGTAASWVNLNPAGSTESSAFGVSGGKQVGYAVVGGVNRASLWSGSAASWVDLHAFLPPSFTSSFARGVWQSAGKTYVVGYGFNTTTMINEALMWGSASVLTGTITLSDWSASTAGEVMQFSIHNMGSSSSLFSQSVTLGAGGAYSVTVPDSISAGGYDLYVDGSPWLRKKMASYNYTGSSASGVNFTLQNGDVDDSGEVDAVDIDLVIANFGGAGPLGDVDGSGEVDAVDIDIVIANFGAIDD